MESRYVYGLALQIAREHGTRELYCLEYNNIASIFVMEENYEEALRYLERRKPKLSHALAGVLGVAAVALFIAFYPYASGMEVSRDWLAAMNWFKNWMWY